MGIGAKTILSMVAGRFDLKRDTTEDRLKLQKAIYLLQAHGLQLGYGFSWYRYGPYSQDLVSDAYSVLGSERANYEEKKRPLKFSPNSEQKFEDFEDICSDVLDDVQQLELVASVDFARRTWYPDADDNELVDKFRQHKKRLFNSTDEISDAEIRKAYHICDELREKQSQTSVT